MNPQLYQEFMRLKERGQKEQARVTLAEFIASFESLDEKKEWTRNFLEAGDYGHKIRHELYEHIVFPVLLDGYRRQDAWATLWLARTASNIYAREKFRAAVDGKDHHTLLREAYGLKPSPELRQELLKGQIIWFNFCQHEWPIAILYGLVEGADIHNCQELLREIEWTRTLDEERRYDAFLTSFEHKVLEYRDRLRSSAMTP